MSGQRASHPARGDRRPHPLAALVHVFSWLGLALLGSGCEAAPEPSAAPVSASESALLQARALVGLDTVFARGFDGTGITVAVIDSGIDTSHADLSGTVVDEACFCGSGCCPGGTTSATGPGSAADDNGHGTHIAGIIASQGLQAPRGGAPGVKLISVKVLSSNLSFCCISDVVAALDWVASTHPEVQVVNLSLGTQSLYAGPCDVLYGTLGQSIASLRANGAVVIAASGNEGSGTTMPSPACISSVLSVGAVWDSNVGPQSTYCTESATAPDQIGCFSNASSALDLLAPGGVIDSTWVGGGTQSHIGTSQSAPMTSACAATVLQADPTLTPDGLETLLEMTGVPIVDGRNGLTFPRIDCAAAVEARVPPDPDEDAGEPSDAGFDAALDAASDAEIDAEAEIDASRDADASGDAEAGIDAAPSAGSHALAGSGSEEPDAYSLDASEPPAAAGSGAAGSRAPRDAGNAGATAGMRDATADREPDADRDDPSLDETTLRGGGGCSCRLAPARDARHTHGLLLGVAALVLAARRRRRS